MLVISRRFLTDWLGLQWPKHPPVFLAQTSKTDTHADLCACKNYYDTLINHNVSGSKLVLMTAEDERCFCIGSPEDPAAKGSPFLNHCDAAWGGGSCSGRGGDGCCVPHTLAFADMVEPATQFVLDVTAI